MNRNTFLFFYRPITPLYDTGKRIFEKYGEKELDKFLEALSDEATEQLAYETHLREADKVGQVIATEFWNKVMASTRVPINCKN